MPASPQPVRERGYAVADAWDLTGEENPQLQWPYSIVIYNRMRRTDSQVSSVLSAVTSPIIRTQWRVDGMGCDEAVVRLVADSLGLPIVGDEQPDTSRARLRGKSRFSWDNHVRLALLMLSFGHSFFEQVYFPPDADGIYRLRKLGERLPQSISKINVARDGGLVSIEQYGFAGDSRPTTLPVSRLVAYVLEREGGNWVGQSLLRSAFKNWRLKDEGLRNWLKSIDRNGVGMPVYEGAEDETDLSNGHKIATEARSGASAGAAIPHGAKLTFKGVEGATVDIDKFIRYNDEQIARSALGHFLNLGSQSGGQVGSYNLGSVFADAFHTGLDVVAGLVADTATAHVVEDLVDLNFGTTVPAPRIVYDEVGTRATELDRAREAVGLVSDADLVKFLRSNPETQEAPA